MRLDSKSTIKTKTCPRIADMHDSAAAIRQKVERGSGGFDGVFCINIELQGKWYSS